MKKPDTIGHLRRAHGDELAAMTTQQLERLDGELGVEADALNLMRGLMPNLLESSRLAALEKRARPPRQVYCG